MSTEPRSIDAAEPHGGFASAEIQKSWLDEAERRVQLMRSGRMQSYPAHEVMADARAMLQTARENR